MNNKGGPRYPEYDLTNSAANPLVERWRGARALSQWISGMPFMNRRIVRNAKTPKHARDMIRIHCQKALQVVRLHVEVTGEPPKIGQGCVVTYNESSFVDVLAYGSVMWDHVDRAAAAELYGKLPFAKEACAKAKIELVPRGDRDGTDRLMNRMVGAVQAGERLGWGADRQGWNCAVQDRCQSDCNPGRRASDTCGLLRGASVDAARVAAGASRQN